LHFLRFAGPEYAIPCNNWAILGGAFEDGNGTTCIGDSGGPHFLDGRIMAVTSASSCGELGFAEEHAQRVDVESVRQFIMSFLDEGDTPE
jgi:hypothetical protein